MTPLKRTYCYSWLIETLLAMKLFWKDLRKYHPWKKLGSNVSSRTEIKKMLLTRLALIITLKKNMSLRRLDYSPERLLLKTLVLKPVFQMTSLCLSPSLKLLSEALQTRRRRRKTRTEDLSFQQTQSLENKEKKSQNLNPALLS